jgi:hypothetical protein
MNHPPDDRILLLAYGELPRTEAEDLEAHLAACPACREQLAGLERTRVALDWAVRRPVRHRRGWVVVLGALAAAAVLAIVLLRPRPEASWLSLTVQVPRYTAPGLAPIDSLLTRLEQEKLYAVP